MNSYKAINDNAILQTGALSLVLFHHEISVLARCDLVHADDKLAEIRHTDVENIARLTTENARTLFKL